MERNEKIEREIADAIIDRPKCFRIGRRQFYLHPVTLGMAYLTQGVIDLLGISQKNLKTQPLLEALRVVKENRENVALLLAYYTLRTKKELLSQYTVKMRMNFFLKELDDDDLTTFFITALAWDNTIEIMRYFKIDKEQKRMEEVMRTKSMDNTFTFGGKTIYGSLIDTACERYGWSYDYVVWEISYTNLRLLLADRTTSMYLSDKEVKRLHLNNVGNVIDGNDKIKIMDAIKNRSWK